MQIDRCNQVLDFDSDILLIIAAEGGIPWQKGIHPVVTKTLNQNAATVKFLFLKIPLFIYIKWSLKTCGQMFLYEVTNRYCIISTHLDCTVYLQVLEVKKGLIFGTCVN